MSPVRQQRKPLPRALFVALAFAMLFGATANSDDRIQLFPQLQPGETLRYESHSRLKRSVKTKSNVATMFEPKPLLADFSTNLQLSVQDFHFMDRRPMLAAETELFSAQSALAENSAPHLYKVGFAIGGDGSVTHADGLDDLEPELRLAWQFWIAQFAFGWTLPASGVKSGERWKSVEAEKVPTPIANLAWERETTYVQDDACPILPSETCAVFLTTATLKQKSKPDDTTPEDYKLHQLKTSGTAIGKNETVAYISRKTGLLMRASEDLQQSLDVTIAKQDGGNQVQYLIEVTSHSETVFVPPSPSASP